MLPHPNNLLGRRPEGVGHIIICTRCANHAIHGCFNPVQPAESIDHNLRTSKTIHTDVIRNVRSIIIQ